MWEILTHLFAWPILHKGCGELIFWARREVLTGEPIVHSDYVNSDGSVCIEFQEIRCPIHRVGPYGCIAGWR